MRAARMMVRGRRLAESLFDASCTVRRATGKTTQDPVTLVEVPVLTVIFTGLPCKVQGGTTQPNEVQVPGQTVVETGMSWHVPISTLGVLVDDQVTIDAVDLVVGDPDLVGMILRVAGPFAKSYATARRFPVEVAS